MNKRKNGAVTLATSELREKIRGKNCTYDEHNSH